MHQMRERRSFAECRETCKNAICQQCAPHHCGSSKTPNGPTAFPFVNDYSDSKNPKVLPH